MTCGRTMPAGQLYKYLDKCHPDSSVCNDARFTNEKPPLFFEAAFSIFYLYPDFYLVRRILRVNTFLSFVRRVSIYIPPGNVDGKSITVDLTLERYTSVPAVFLTMICASCSGRFPCKTICPVVGLGDIVSTFFSSAAPVFILFDTAARVVAAVFGDTG